MTRKPLPKVIRRSDADRHVVHAEPDVEAPAPQRPAPQAPPQYARAQAHAPAHAYAQPEILPPLVNNSVLPASPVSQSQAEKRLRDAFKIVERHKFYAGLGGLFPIPAMNVAGVTAINLRMVKRLSELYETPFEHDKNRTIVLGLMGGAAPTGLAALTSSTLTLVMPGAGLAVSSLTAAALTRGIGMFFVERFEKGAFG
jgi:uncharacterized protein (DUF697 family)